MFRHCLSHLHNKHTTQTMNVPVCVHLPFVFCLLDSFLVVNDEHAEFLLQFAHLIQRSARDLGERLVQLSVYPVVKQQLGDSMVRF